jgi:hypothetical protein
LSNQSGGPGLASETWDVSGFHYGKRMKIASATKFNRKSGDAEGSVVKSGPQIALPD